MTPNQLIKQCRDDGQCIVAAQVEMGLMQGKRLFVESNHKPPAGYAESCAYFCCYEQYTVYEQLLTN